MKSDRCWKCAAENWVESTEEKPKYKCWMCKYRNNVPVVSSEYVPDGKQSQGGGAK